MNKLSKIQRLIHEAKSGDIQPSSNLDVVDEVLGFSFGLNFDQNGQLASPGPVNESLAEYIIHDEVLRTKNMTLQEELAVAIESREPRLGAQINSLKTIKQPFQAYNTHELIMQVEGDFHERAVRSLAVVAFRHHMPRAAAQVEKAGFDVVIPDVSRIGSFDPNSSQPWIRNEKSWIERERKVILAFALMGRL